MTSDTPVLVYGDITPYWDTSYMVIAEPDLAD